MQLADGTTVADYKLEIYLSRERSVFKDVSAILSTWLSGGGTTGDCDEGMFWCLDAAKIVEPGTFAELAKQIRTGEATTVGCGHVIPPSNILRDVAICPNCQRKWNPKRMTMLLPFHGSLQDLSTLLAHFFYAAGSSMDFYLKFSREKNMRIMVEEAKEKNAFKAKELLNEAPEKLEVAIYTLKRLQEDLATGSTLESRLKAFLTV